MEIRADEVYAAHLRLGRLLPLPLVVLLSLIRGAALTFLVAAGGGGAAPAFVVVTRRSDGSRVGRLSAGREPYVGESLLLSVQATMRDMTPEAFLKHWHLHDAGCR